MKYFQKRLAVDRIIHFLRLIKLLTELSRYIISLIDNTTTSVNPNYILQCNIRVQGLYAKCLIGLISCSVKYSSSHDVDRTSRVFQKNFLSRTAVETNHVYEIFCSGVKNSFALAAVVHWTQWGNNRYGIWNTRMCKMKFLPYLYKISQSRKISSCKFI